VGVTAYYPHIHTALPPETVSAKLVLFRFLVLRPFRFHQAMIAIWEAAEPVRISALPADMLFAGAANIFNSAFEPSLHCPFARHQ
jgi:hypothetical protein